MGTKKLGRHLFSGAVIIFMIMLIAMGVNIEIKLSELSDAAPVAVYTFNDETQTQISSEAISTTATTTATTTEAATTLPQIASATTINTASETQAYTTVTAATVENIITTTCQGPEVITDCSDAPTAEATTHPELITERTTSPALITERTTEFTTFTVTTAQFVEADQNFYVTKTGTKYHRADCSYLSKSKIAVTVDEIIAGGYEPCSRCMKGE